MKITAILALLCGLAAAGTPAGAQGQRDTARPAPDQTPSAVSPGAASAADAPPAAGLPAPRQAGNHAAPRGPLCAYVDLHQAATRYLTSGVQLASSCARAREPVHG